MWVQDKISYMPIIGPKPDENKFETLTLLTPACRFINMSWTVVASSFHSMSQNLYKMFQNIWKAFCHRKWYLLYKNIANMISPMKFDVTEYYSSLSLNTAGPTFRWDLWYSQALMVSTSSAWLAHYFSARTLLTACGIPVFHQRFPGTWGLWTPCLKSAIWKSTLAVLNITWRETEYFRGGMREHEDGSKHSILGSVCFGSPQAQTRRAPLQLTSSLLCSARKIFFWSINFLPFSCKMSIGKNILLDFVP